LASRPGRGDGENGGGAGPGFAGKRGQFAKFLPFSGIIELAAALAKRQRLVLVPHLHRTVTWASGELAIGINPNRLRHTVVPGLVQAPVPVAPFLRDEIFVPIVFDRRKHEITGLCTLFEGGKDSPPLADELVQFESEGPAGDHGRAGAHANQVGGGAAFFQAPG
jgi:hypothetical protein